MTFKERLAWLARHEIELLQFGDELERLDAYFTTRGPGFKRWPPRSLVEIGMWQGGSLFMLAGYMAPGATIIGVDPSPEPANRAKVMRVAEELVRQGFDAHALQRTSKTAARTIPKLLEARGGQIDFLHIDGSHRYQDVRDDFQRYAPVVPSGGIIQLHDVVNVNPRTGDEYGTKRFWEEIAPRYPVHAVFANTKGGRIPGIGILVV